MKKLFFTALVLWSCQNIEIIDKPITFDEERKELSLQYIKDHYGLEVEEPVIDPKIIVIHWTVIPTLEETFEAFNPSVLPSTRANIQAASSLNVSSQFVIDRDGTIYQLLPETTFSRHVIGLNYSAIGIENIANGTDLPLTEAQFESNLKLANYLSKKYDIEYLIGHDQYESFIGHELWLEKDASYLTEKDDVGEEFINRLHDQLNIKLKKAPQK
ncbi:peptidoglycan recognition protein family protein [Fulvivirga lutimaris]|uniref:peptidoglycan recognition protein family protein n=1 Tax=Fulvivirga lutimaris TaxID=1819566 RepID=UPI0012BCC04C|nr:peptidoglycan recognition family protein [Fulvivirga lutimaris]MTI39989.1 N-acetylmuramoyl-L-alanine amidase [Fulvivirga lutimaris]